MDYFVLAQIQSYTVCSRPTVYRGLGILPCMWHAVRFNVIRVTVRVWERPAPVELGVDRGYLRIAFKFDLRDPENANFNWLWPVPKLSFSTAIHKYMPTWFHMGLYQSNIKRNLFRRMFNSSPELLRAVPYSYSQKGRAVAWPKYAGVPPEQVPAVP